MKNDDYYTILNINNRVMKINTYDELEMIRIAVKRFESKKLDKFNNIINKYDKSVNNIISITSLIISIVIGLISYFIINKFIIQLTDIKQLVIISLFTGTIFLIINGIELKKYYNKINTIQNVYDFMKNMSKELNKNYVYNIDYNIWDY